ncbi:MAG: helix-turn-helix transcriptional regulator [Christensenella sp.]|nr:helix-turn-helix transcriptional regulator [Christensenella sp.]
MEKKSCDTSDLIKLLHHGALDDVLRCGDVQPVFTEYLAQLCSERNATRERVIQRAGIERSYGHQLFNGIRRPSRDKALQLAFGLELDAERTQALLRAAKVGQLTPHAKRDAVILYGLMHHLSLNETRTLLSNFSLPPLGSE